MKRVCVCTLYKYCNSERWEIVLQDGLPCTSLFQVSKRFESGPGGVVDLVRAAIVDRPLEHFQVTTPRCKSACPFIPRESLAPEPFQYIQVTTLSCSLSAFTIAPAIYKTIYIHALEPLHDLQMATFAGSDKGIGINNAHAGERLVTLELPGAHLSFALPFNHELLFEHETQPLQGFQLASTRCEEEKGRKKSEE